MLNTLFNLIAAVLVLGLAFAIVDYAVRQIPLLQPLAWVVRVLAALVALWLIVSYLFPLVHLPG